MVSSDSIFIDQLALDAIIGIYEHERGYRQRLILDLSLTTDLRLAGTTDRLQDTVDYALLCDRMRNLAAARPYGLLETLGQELAALVLQDHRIDQVTIKLRKPGALRHAAASGICITRARQRDG